MQRRIKRDFRQMSSPAKFLGFCKKVLHCLPGTPNLPDSIAALLQLYSASVERLDTIYHQALVLVATVM